MKIGISAFGFFAVFFVCSHVQASPSFTLNEQEVFEAPAAEVLVFSNWYNGLFSDSKMSGVEVIHHGVRIVTNGDVRLHATPEQWDPIPAFVKRISDPKKGTVEAKLRYADYDFDFSIVARAKGDTVFISVNLPKKLPKALEGKAGFNLEFLPSAYFEHSFLMDSTSGTFPLYPTGAKEQNDKVAATPLAVGNVLTFAPESQERRIQIRSKHSEISLFDGRNKAQNGWFVARSLLPSNKKGKVLEWELRVNSSENWLREPVITYSQVGYHPKHEKVAYIELDKNDKAEGKAKLLRIESNGSKVVLNSDTTLWGNYKRYQYLSFDFSRIKQAGLYQIEFRGQKTEAFRIADDVYASAWHPTLDVFFPVQMDHVLVNEAYRVWHGASHLDDALQAPVGIEHFDLYAQGPTTDTQYQPGEHIPGLNIGGWYDAGDYDIRTQTQYRTVSGLVDVWEEFGIARDTTLVDYPSKYVDIHVPDGKSDILQQIEHGTLALIAQHRAVGHAIPGIIVPDISQYTHLGDGLTMTDNLIYDASMGENESDGKRSGKFDDRWAFTTETSALNYGSIAALVAASRALKEHNPGLAKESYDTAIAAWKKERSREEPLTFRHGNTTGGSLDGETLKAAVELLISSGADEYKQVISELLPKLEPSFAWMANDLLRAVPHMGESYKSDIRRMALAYKENMQNIAKQNPFGVLITEGGWAGNGAVIGMGVTNYRLHKLFPDLFSKEDVLRSLHYLFGRHPGSNISFVSNVGTKSKKVAYGMNRADYSFISGGIVPGVLILKPDFPENKEDWPFLWGENEYVINLGASYIFLANAANRLVSE